MPSETKQEAAKSNDAPAAPAEKKPKRASARKAKPKRGAKRKAAKAAKSKSPRASATKPSAKPKATRRQTSRAQRAKILAIADREKLTALQVQKRFGVKPVTYYSWRKANKQAGRSVSPRLGVQLAGIDMAAETRKVVRAQIMLMLPEIIAKELAAVLGVPTSKRQK